MALEHQSIECYCFTMNEFFRVILFLKTLSGHNPQNRRKYLQMRQQARCKSPKFMNSSYSSRRSNQSVILKEIHPECSLEGLMLKLKPQYSGYLMRRTNSLKKTLMLGKIEGRRRRGQQRILWLDGITKLIDMSFSKLQGMVMDR